MAEGFAPIQIEDIKPGDIVLVDLPAEAEVVTVEDRKVTCKTKDGQSHVVYVGQILWRRVPEPDG